MNSRSSRAGQAMETVVMVAIMLVLVQTFLEDFAVVRGWSRSVRDILVFSGLFFDLFFTVEFLARLYSAIRKGDGREYIVSGKGWIDLLASVPLLLLSSGPAAAALVAGGGAVGGAGGMLNLLKIVKAVRIARILRLLRVLKIFKRIKNAESVMAQRHVSRIAATAVSVFVLVILAVSVTRDVAGLPSASASADSDMIDIMLAWENGGPQQAEAFRNLLIVKKDGKTVFSRYDNDYYRKYFGFEEYAYAEYSGFGFFFDQRELLALQAMDSLLYFILIISMVAAFTFFYSPHFALTVSDPIHVMRRGLSEKSYNLEVRIENGYKDDDVFRLAEEYNKHFLPMKDRSMAEENDANPDSLELKINDLKDLF